MSRSSRDSVLYLVLDDSGTSAYYIDNSGRSMPSHGHFERSLFLADNRDLYVDEEEEALVVSINQILTGVEGSYLYKHLQKRLKIKRAL